MWLMLMDRTFFLFFAYALIYVYMYVYMYVKNARRNILLANSRLHIYNRYMMKNKISYNNTIFKKFKELKKKKPYVFNAATIRYINCSGSYVIRGYCQSLDRIDDIKVLETDLIATLYDEKDAIQNLDDDSYSDIQFLQCEFLISLAVLKDAERQWKRKRNKNSSVDTSVIHLKHRKMTKERIMSPNIENYDRVYENAIRNARYYLFELLVKEWCRYQGIVYRKKEWIEKYRLSKQQLIETGQFTIYK